jgi:hypothetical protein
MSIWDLSPEVDVKTIRRMWRHFLRAGGLDGEYQVWRTTGEPIRRRRAIAIRLTLDECRASLWTRKS